jgi:SAM-dependent methyltransferase
MGRKSMNSESSIIGKRWDFSADGFSNLICDELKTGLPEAWEKLILDAAHKDGVMDILDLGTGPGFFSLILSMRGHRVTGIYCSEKMLERAAQNAAALGVSPVFRLMDVTKTDFPDNSFDMIVSRNLTWILYEPETAFIEWKRILRPGGRLVYFDGSWYPETYSPEKLASVKEDERLYRKKYGDPVDTYIGDRETERKFDDIVTLGKLQRPEWDAENLPCLGFRDIKITDNVNSLIHQAPQKLLYRHMPMFMVSAGK